MSLEKSHFWSICHPIFILISLISLPSSLSIYESENDSSISAIDKNQRSLELQFDFRTSSEEPEDDQNITFSSLRKHKHKHKHGSRKKRHRRTSLPSISPGYSPRIVNVDDFGAKADGNDDSQAFKKAWNAVCSSSQGAVLVVPRNKTYRLNPITFSGPCESEFTIFMLHGTIEASTDLSIYKDRRHWIVFESVINLKVEGGGSINGNGQIWWRNSCKIDKSLPCTAAPTAVTFMECKNLAVSKIAFRNSQKMHLSFQKCVNVRASNLQVTAPGNSPNTDGIHVTATKNILIENSVIRTGDDCISIVSGSRNVRATGITCGPGHGISIGSLGAGKSSAFVSNVEVNRATITGTTNGLRIKTWQGGNGYARNIKFENVLMKNVTNPIIITQYYCDKAKPCYEQKSAVQVSNVMYRNIGGTSSSDVAVKFDCSKSFPCRGILMEDVVLANGESKTPKAECSNVKLDSRGKVFPRCS